MGHQHLTVCRKRTLLSGRRYNLLDGHLVVVNREFAMSVGFYSLTKIRNVHLFLL